MTRRLLQIIFIASLAPFVLATAFSQHEDISPREYCDKTGGEVTETGYQKVYICCYTAKKKCVLSNIVNGYSRLILLDDTQLALK